MTESAAKTKDWLAEPARPAGASAKAEARRGKGWPPSRRRAQAARIRKQRPWRRSTGPRTPEGKARTRLNAQKPHTALLRRWKSLLREHRRFLRAVDLFHSRHCEERSDEAIQNHGAAKGWIASPAGRARNDGLSCFRGETFAPPRLRGKNPS